jgi:serine/threonine protein kinase
LGEHQSTGIISERILSGKIIFPDKFPILARNLIEKMLKVNPLERITLKEALNHPWLVEFNNQTEWDN